MKTVKTYRKQKTTERHQSQSQSERVYRIGRTSRTAHRKSMLCDRRFCCALLQFIFIYAALCAQLQYETNEKDTTTIDDDVVVFYPSENDFFASTGFDCVRLFYNRLKIKIYRFLQSIARNDVRRCGRMISIARAHILVNVRVFDACFDSINGTEAIFEQTFSVQNTAATQTHHTHAHSLELSKIELICKIRSHASHQFSFNCSQRAVCHGE